ncbi:MAG: pyridoxal-phosphate dependent enzyme [Rhodothermales bacterium]|nr:pyridoxal-phosphate dependent enzyme [Rhodothermales bacterium]
MNKVTDDHHRAATGLTADLVEEARSVTDGRLLRTPVVPSPALSEVFGVRVHLKLECLQVTGSFKARGALFAMHRLRAQGVREVSACSAGNHGKGIAWAASELGMKAVVFVPRSVDASKLEAMRSLGASVELSEFVGYDDTEAWALEEAERRGLPWVSAYDDPAVMAANGGTVALEVLEQAPEARTFVMPVGGGGHAAGFTFMAGLRLADTRFVMCQHRESPGFQLSVDRGEPVTELPAIETLASGLEGGFGTRTFEILRDRYDEIRLVSEEEIRNAMRWMARRHGLIIEGSSAAAVAACLQNPPIETVGDVVVFISGRNIAMNTALDVLGGG